MISIDLASSLSLTTTLGGRNDNSEDVENDESAENVHSLLDADADNDGDKDESGSRGSSRTPTQASQQNNDGEQKIKSSGSSRRISLPEDYNKLEIPKLKNVNFDKLFRKVLNVSADADILKTLEKIDGISKADESGLNIQVDVKVRDIREVDEINEVQCTVSSSVHSV